MAGLGGLRSFDNLTENGFHLGVSGYRFRLVPLMTALLAVVALATGCGGDDGAPGADSGDGAVTVLATTPQLADVSAEVAGSAADVRSLLGANVDPHDYDPSPADLQALAEADVVVRNGLDVDGWLQEALDSSGFDGTLVTASEGVRVRELDGETDPHIWQDPRNVVRMTATIAAGLREAAPDAAAEIDRSEKSYVAELTELDREIATRIAAVPPQRRKLVTNHDAFGYYADRYGLEVVGSIIPSFDTSAELSGRALNDIVGKIRASGAPAVFSESSLPPQTARTIAQQAGVEVVAGEDSLYGDSLGPRGSGADTYLTMMEHNTDVIVEALR